MEQVSSLSDKDQATQLMECRCIHSSQFPHSSLLMGRPHLPPYRHIRKRNRQALAQSIVGAVAQPLSVGIGIKVECIHYIAISGNRIVCSQMDVLVPMRTTYEDNGIRLYGTNCLDTSTEYAFTCSQLSSTGSLKTS